MDAFSRKLICSLALTSVFAGPAFASPLSSKLLPLVPPGAEIVAGFENHAEEHRHGQLILSTRSDRLDLDDWQALTGVDNKRVVEEVIEVAASLPGRGMLTEHLVLVSGRFDKEHIFRAAELNGAKTAECERQIILLIEPFPRERDEIHGERWLVILDNRIGMLGTPYLVASALRRYLVHADIDMPLMERLSQLRSDNTSWNVLLWSPRALSNYNVSLSESVWGRLLQDSDELIVGSHFGSKVRIDFSLHSTGDLGTAFLQRKADLFAEAFGADPTPQSGPSHWRQIQSLSFEENHVQGSIELSLQQFEEWGEQANRPHVYLVPRNLAHGE